MRADVLGSVIFVVFWENKLLPDFLVLSWRWRVTRSSNGTCILSFFRLSMQMSMISKPDNNELQKLAIKFSKGCFSPLWRRLESIIITSREPLKASLLSIYHIIQRGSRYHITIPIDVIALSKSSLRTPRVILLQFFGFFLARLENPVL